MTLNLDTKTNFSDDFFSIRDGASDTAEKIERILIVDDEEVVRRFHLDCLSHRYQCLEAASAEEALEVLKEEQVSLVITDWVMTGMSGTTLLRRIIREFPDTFVIMITGIDHPERSLDTLRFGAFDYLIKPSKPEIIELTVERALEQRDVKIKARQYKIDLELQSIELTRQKAEIERLNAQIERTKKPDLSGEPSAEIAHELNNPLGYISGNLQILELYFQDIRKLLGIYEAAEMSEKETSKIEDFKDKIHYKEMFENIGAVITDCAEGVQRVSRIVRNISDFSDAEQTEIVKRDTDEHKEELL